MGMGRNLCAGFPAARIWGAPRRSCGCWIVLFCVLAVAAVPFPLGTCLAATATDLRCEYRFDPLGIDATPPRLSWTMEDGNNGGLFGFLKSAARERGQKQTAYRVLVASTPQRLASGQGDLWDSGKIASDRSIQVEYAGKPLVSRQTSYWKVRIWDKEGQASDWSAPAAWTMGLLNSGDWKARWIAAPKTRENADAAFWIRKEFSLDAVPERALAFVNPQGYCELYINGQKVGNDVLAPAVSKLPARSLYVTYDIARLLRPGKNCVGLWLDNGWAGRNPLVRAQIDWTVGGKPTTLGTDRTWLARESPRSRIGMWCWGNYGGERVDARLDVPDWSKVGCKTETWREALEMTPREGAVSAQSCPPNRIGAKLPLASCSKLTNGVYELDFGANLSGWMRLRLPGLKTGQKITIHYADKRFQTPSGDNTPAGRVASLEAKVFAGPRGPVGYQTFKQTDEFISAGRDGEAFCSKFNYHGFRYAIVEGLPSQPAAGDAEALLIDSDLEPAGAFACSNERFNRIHALNLWTIRCLNLGGYMVDCPHRERLGYGGDGHVSMESQIMSCDAAAFYGKWARDWLDFQKPSGEFPHTAPTGGGGGGPAWGGLGCVIPWKMYVYYGDRRLLEQSYGAMRRYAEFLESQCSNGVLRAAGGRWDRLGDWVPPGRGMDTDRWPPVRAAELFNNGYRLYLLEQLAKAADVLGKGEDARRWRARMDVSRPLIHAEYYDSEKGIYVLDEQPYYAMPLMSGIAPPDFRNALMKKLEDNIRVKCQGHFETGLLGTYFLIQYLQESGRDDLLFPLFNQTTYPSWGYMLSQDATTLWEQWNGYYSQIHACFACPSGWFCQGLAGIRPDEAGPGFQRFVIKPAVVGDVTWVKSHYDSPRGRIVSKWERKGDDLRMDVTVPANTTATVYVPAKNLTEVTESGKPAHQSPGVRLLRRENNVAVFEVGAGRYRFRSEWASSDGAKK